MSLENRVMTHVVSIDTRIGKIDFVRMQTLGGEIIYRMALEVGERDRVAMSLLGQDTAYLTINAEELSKLPRISIGSGAYLENLTGRRNLGDFVAEIYTLSADGFYKNEQLKASKKATDFQLEKATRLRLFYNARIPVVVTLGAAGVFLRNYPLAALGLAAVGVGGFAAMYVMFRKAMSQYASISRKYDAILKEQQLLDQQLKPLIEANAVLKSIFFGVIENEIAKRRGQN